MVKYLSLKLHCSGPITESPAMITLNGVEQLVKPMENARTRFYLIILLANLTIFSSPYLPEMKSTSNWTEIS